MKHTFSTSWEKTNRRNGNAKRLILEKTPPAGKQLYKRNGYYCHEKGKQLLGTPRIIKPKQEKTITRRNTAPMRHRIPKQRNIQRPRTTLGLYAMARNFPDVFGTQRHRARNRTQTSPTKHNQVKWEDWAEEQKIARSERIRELLQNAPRNRTAANTKCEQAKKSPRNKPPEIENTQNIQPEISPKNILWETRIRK